MFKMFVGATFFFLTVSAFADGVARPGVCINLFPGNVPIIHRTAVLTYKSVLERFRRSYRTPVEATELSDLGVSRLSATAPIYAFDALASDIVSDGNAPHMRQTMLELKSSMEYAATVIKDREEQLLFMPKYNGWDVPGFDGIIYRDGLPIANYSLKATNGSWKDPLNDALTKAKNLSVNEMRWFFGMTDHDFALAPRMVVPQHQYETIFKDVTYLMGLYDVHLTSCVDCSHRPTRVVIHMLGKSKNYLANNADRRTIIDTLKEEPETLESVTLLFNDGAVEFTADGSLEYPLD